MSNLFITNSFSINMLEGGTMVDFIPMSIEEVKKYISRATTGSFAANIVSAIGHADMAKIVSDQLEMAIPMNRVSIKLSVERGKISDTALVAQYSGPRLAEGATSLPDGAEIRYWLVVPGMEFCTEPI